MKMQKIGTFLLSFWLFTACTATIQPATQIINSPTPPPSTDSLSKIIYASDPDLPGYDPNSPAFAEFPGAVNQLSNMGSNAVDAADDLAVAIRFPRHDSYLAAQALLKLGPDITATTIPILLDNLNKKPEARIYSVILLGSLGHKASCAVGDIAPLLWDSDSLVRSAAALALEKITAQDLVETAYEVPVTPSFMSGSISADTPDGKVVKKARLWWDAQGSKVNWHPSYGICDP